MSTYEQLVTIWPDFPEEGVEFKDINPIFADAAATQELVADMAEGLAGEVDIVAGLDARGFILGPLVAQELGVGFVPFRKPGRLPGPVVSAEYTKEYGVDTLEAQIDSIRTGQRVVIVDDVIATGGTALAAAELVEQLACIPPVAVRAAVDIAALGGSARIASAGIDVAAVMD